LASLKLPIKKSNADANDVRNSEFVGVGEIDPAFDDLEAMSLAEAEAHLEKVEADEAVLV
jgi:hypothetical protein